MATYSVTQAKHAALTASTVDTVTLTGRFRHVLVINRTGTGEISFTVATPATEAGPLGAPGTAGVTPPVPTVAGDNTYMLPAAVGSQLLEFDPGKANIEVSLICGATPQSYSVVGLDV